MKRGKTVLMPFSSGGVHVPRMLSGVQRVADAEGWEFVQVEYQRFGDGILHALRAPSDGTPAQLVERYRPDGILLPGGDIPDSEILAATERFRPAGFPRRAPLPVVLLNREAEVPGFSGALAVAAEDSGSFAELAAAELFRSGFADFAYAPFSDDKAWSRDRGDAFARACVRARKRFHAYSGTVGFSDRARLAEFFEPWVAALPKPCGVFAANDIAGEAVLRACAALGLAVPEDVAVVGVDDNFVVCDHTRPSLSSVRRDFEGEGQAAAELLAAWMDRPGQPPRARPVPAVSLTRRSSTRYAALRDRRVARAQEWIRVHAGDYGVGPADVARQMGVSRTQADRLFRTAAERTILGEIRAARVERAKAGLRAGQSADIVAADCGFSSTSDFRRTFRALCGQTVTAWRRGQGMV